MTCIKAISLQFLDKIATTINTTLLTFVIIGDFVDAWRHQNLRNFVFFMFTYFFILKRKNIFLSHCVRLKWKKENNIRRSFFQIFFFSRNRRPTRCSAIKFALVWYCLYVFMARKALYDHETRGKRKQVLEKGSSNVQVWWQKRKVQIDLVWESWHKQRGKRLITNIQTLYS